MADVVLIAILIAFTMLCVAYISWCDRIVGPDQPTADDGAVRVDVAAEPETVTA